MFTINATVNTDNEGLVLRFEVRTSSLNLLVLLDHHKEEWLQDLVGDRAKLIISNCAPFYKVPSKD